MTEIQPEDALEYGDYDLEEDVTPVEISEALPYPDVDVHDTEATGQVAPVGFTSRVGVTPAEAISKARSWSNSRYYVGGSGLCLMTVRQYYGVSSGVPTAAASYTMSAHKHNVAHGTDCPRGTPVYWTGGSRGAGHIVISLGGGYCLSTDWKEAGRIDVARIDDITSHWGLTFRGYTYEVNGVQVWAPAPPPTKVTVSLSNLRPKESNNDVLQLKKRLKAKGYTGFIVTSKTFGTGTQAAYAKYQRRLGFSGKDANGIPGKSSLQKLGFDVTN